MYTYIKNDIHENHVELPELLDSELYDNIGETFEDYLNGKWVLLNEEQVLFLNENPKVSMKEVFEMRIDEPVVKEKTLESSKEHIKKLILQYDNSNQVNLFYMYDHPMWLDKATRAGLKLRFEAEVAMGKTETTLWYNNLQFSLRLEDAIKMLYAIEVYASESYDNTQKHLSEIEKLETIEDVEAYNYFAFYPNILRFPIIEEVEEIEEEVVSEVIEDVVYDEKPFMGLDTDTTNSENIEEE